MQTNQQRYSPGQAARLHHVGQRHVVGPHVVLPLPQAQHAAEHAARVQTHAHVQVHLGGLHHRPARGSGAFRAGPYGPKSSTPKQLGHVLYITVYSMFLMLIQYVNQIIFNT